MFFKYKGINIEGDLQQNLIVKAYNILKNTIHKFQMSM